jgi:hypothetical protein
MFNEGRTNVQGACPSSLRVEKQDPPYSLHLAPSDFHLFTHLMQFWGSTHMGSDEEVKTLKDWFNGLAAYFCDAGIQKLVTRYGKCLNLHGDYVEKLFTVCTNHVKYIFF